MKNQKRKIERKDERTLFHDPDCHQPPITGSGDILAMMVRGNAETPEMGHPVSTTINQERDFEEREETRRRPIVSIRGEDIPEEPESDRSAA